MAMFKVSRKTIKKYNRRIGEPGPGRIAGRRTVWCVIEIATGSIIREYDNKEEAKEDMILRNLGY